MPVAVALAYRVEDGTFVEVAQQGKVLHPVEQWWVGLLHIVLVHLEHLLAVV